MRASRGASLGEANGPSHPVELVRFEFVGELAEFSLLLVIGVLKHVGMQRLEIRFELRAVYVEAFQFGELFLGLLTRGECRQWVSPPLISCRALGWTVSSSVALCIAGSRRWAAEASRRLSPRAAVTSVNSFLISWC